MLTVVTLCALAVIISVLGVDSLYSCFDTQQLTWIVCRIQTVSGVRFGIKGSDGKIDSNRFARPNRFESIHTAES